MAFCVRDLYSGSLIRQTASYNKIMLTLQNIEVVKDQKTLSTNHVLYSQESKAERHRRSNNPCG